MSCRQNMHPSIVMFGKWLSRNWKCTKEWKDHDNNLRLDYLCEKYGDQEVPVTNYLSEYFSRYEMPFREYVDHLRKNSETILYLKDWHLALFDPTFYDIPKYFTSDWLNEFCIAMNRSDYRFVYIGQKGTKTPLHRTGKCAKNAMCSDYFHISAKLGIVVNLIKETY